MARVVVICHDSPTRDTCPTLYASDDGRCFVQGYVVSDPDVLAQMSIPDGETVVQITPELLRKMTEPDTAQQVHTQSGTGPPA